MNRFLIYVNGNGTDKYPLSPCEQPEDKYAELLEELKDGYFETTAIYVEVDDNLIKEVFEVFIPDLDEVTSE